MKITEKLELPVNEVGSVTISFLGDSVTHGFFESSNGMHGTVDFEAVYHSVLKKKLNRRYITMPVNIINAGIGGKNAAHALTRLDRDVISHSPDLCVVMFGLNDINDGLEEYTGSLEKIFIKLQDAGIEVIFMTPNMLNTYVDKSLSGGLLEYAKKTAQYQTSGRMDKYIAVAVDTANKAGVPVCDCYKIWRKMYDEGVDTTSMLANRINHPARKMHELFADELYKIIVKE